MFEAKITCSGNHFSCSAVILAKEYFDKSKFEEVKLAA